MSQENESKSATSLIQHDDYIELRFEEVSRQAVDELVDHVIQIVDGHRTHQTVRIFVNSSQINRSQSINYLFQRIRDNRKHFVVDFRVRLAVTFNMMLIASLLELFLNSLPTSVIFKAFSKWDEDGAVDWLLKDD